MTLSKLTPLKACFLLQYLLCSVLMIPLVSKWTHSNLSDFLEFFTLSSHWDLLLLLMLSWLCQNWRHLEPLCALGCENLMNVLTFRNGCECTYIRASSIFKVQAGHPNWSTASPRDMWPRYVVSFLDTWLLGVREFQMRAKVISRAPKDCKILIWIL